MDRRRAGLQRPATEAHVLSVRPLGGDGGLGLGVPEGAPGRLRPGADPEGPESADAVPQGPPGRVPLAATDPRLNVRRSVGLQSQRWPRRWPGRECAWSGFDPLGTTRPGPRLPRRG